MLLQRDGGLTLKGNGLGRVGGVWLLEGGEVRSGAGPGSHQ